MSALTLLSVPASPAPGPPQGRPGPTASGFGALLTVETGEDAGLPEAKQAQVADRGDDEPGTDSSSNDGAPTEQPGAPGLTMTAVVAPPLASASGAEHISDGGTSGPVASAAAEDPDPLKAGSGSALRFEALPDAPMAGTAPVVGANDLQVRPGLGVVGGPSLPDGETAANMAGSAALKEAERAELRSGAGAAAPPVMQTPLRPLAERTSRPLEAPAAGTGDAAGDGGSAAAKAATPTPAARAAAPSGTARDGITVPPVTAPAPDGAPAELAPSGDGAAVEADAPTVVREAALSQLSRVTVEATAQIAAQILRRLEGRSTRFEIALTPAELGRVDVKLDIDSEGRLQARLAFDNPAAATDLRGRADELRRQLEDAGFDLGENALEFTERDSGSSAFDRGQGGHNGQSRAFTVAARLNAEIDVAQPPGWMVLTLSPSGVDMKV